MALHAIEGAGIFGRVRHAGDHGGEGFVVEADFGEEADLRVDLDDVGKFFNFLAGVFIERAGRLLGFGLRGRGRPMPRKLFLGVTRIVSKRPLCERRLEASS